MGLSEGSGEVSSAGSSARPQPGAPHLQDRAGRETTGHALAPTPNLKREAGEADSSQQLSLTGPCPTPGACARVGADGTCMDCSGAGQTGGSDSETNRKAPAPEATPLQG